ncbi:MAG TPA: Rne/Rng family ribonuclease [Jatrophihabitantaceae bacterium]|nr:Rne/Rng family ribonuclease [Jatrophihabitantaceae bacterium]
MLESDNPENPTTSDASSGDAAVSVAQPPSKPRRAPRKAPAKKAGAKTPNGPVAADPGDPTEPAAAAAKASAPRKRAPKRPAAKAPAPAANAAPAVDAVPAADAAEPLAGAAEPAAPPARRRRRATQPAQQDMLDGLSAASSSDGVRSDEKPVVATAAVLFVAPAEAPAPAPRRRAQSKPDPVALAAEVPEDIAAEVDEDPDEVREAAAEEASGERRRRRRGRRGRGGGRVREGGPDSTDDDEDDEDKATDGLVDAVEAPVDADTDEDDGDGSGPTRRRRRRRRKTGTGDDEELSSDDPPNTVVHVREVRTKSTDDGGGDGVRGVKGSTRLEAKRQRRRDGRESGRRRPPILTESEFLARREAVDRVMAVRQHGDRTQIAVLEDGILVEHYVTRASATSYVGNVYLGRVQNVLPSMEAAFIDIGKGRNGVLYAGEVNWDLAGLEGKARAIENALSPGDAVLVQVTKDPIGHKGARLTSQVSLPGRFLVYVPGAGMTGISRKLPDTERHRLKSILKKIVPEDAGVIVRTAAEGASEEDLIHDVERLKAQWESIQRTAAKPKAAPTLVYGEPDLAIRVVRDVFNEDFRQLVVSGSDAWQTISTYVKEVAPDLGDRLIQHTAEGDLFHDMRVDEQLTKALDRKVYLPSGGSLVIDRTEAMTVIDVNTGKFVGSGGNLEQTVTRNNLEAAEEIVRQLRLRDVGGIVVIDFIDMVLESNRELVLRRLTECLGRDRTKHQVAEVTSLGLVQMTRKRVGEGLLEAFSEVCPTCGGRGVLVHTEPVEQRRQGDSDEKPARRKGKQRSAKSAEPEVVEPPLNELNEEQRKAAASAMAAIAGVVGADEDTEPTEHVEPAGHLEPTEHVEPTERVEAASGAAEVDPAEDAPTEDAPTARPRRRRRAASRPAGPPVAADAH